MSEVRLFRLNSGEEVLAKVIDNASDSGEWTIKSPAILLPMGSGKLGLAPWLPYCETENMLLPNKAVAFVAVPKKQMVNDYNSNFGSGLLVPDTDIQEAPAPSLKLIAD